MSDSSVILVREVIKSSEKAILTVKGQTGFVVKCSNVKSCKHQGLIYIFIKCVYFILIHNKRHSHTCDQTSLIGWAETKSGHVINHRLMNSVDKWSLKFKPARYFTPLCKNNSS